MRLKLVEQCFINIEGSVYRCRGSECVHISGVANIILVRWEKEMAGVGMRTRRE